VRPFDLLIFDFDGTLADSAIGIAACMRAAFEEFGLEPPSPAQVRVRIGLTLEESIRQLTTGEVDVAAVAARYRELHDSVAAPAIALFAGAVEAVSAAKAAGMQLAVVSQKARRGLRQLLAQFAITDRFDLVLGSDDVTAHKPDAALYERHIEPVLGSSRLQAEKFPAMPRHRVLVVGDTATDIQFATNIGASSCWAAYGYGNGQQCAALQPTFRISHISELRAVCAGEPLQ
jgi:phosphoglycolate phosphatase